MKVVLASGNPGKIVEIQRMLDGCGIELIPQTEFGIHDVPETGTTFYENAIIKARNAAEVSGLPAVADDSGLCVDYLEGGPGVYTARYGGMEKLLANLEGVPTEQRGMTFHCVAAFMRNAKDPAPILSHGVWRGRAHHEAVGDHGFGYDPVFFVPEHQCTSAQLEPAVKNQLSHRGRCFEALKDYLLSEYATDTHV